MSKRNPRAVGCYYFAVVGRENNLLFNLDFVNGKDANIDDPTLMTTFMAHAGLDIIDYHKWKTTNMYLKTVEKFNNSLVSAFVTASLLRFVLVHENKNDDAIGNFFSEIYELYIKYSMNPFYEDNTPIKSLAFKNKALLYAKKYLCF